MKRIITFFLLFFQFFCPYWVEVMSGMLAFVVVFLTLLFILILGINHLLPKTFMGLMFSLAQSLLGMGAFFMFLFYRKIGDEIFEYLHSTITSFIFWSSPQFNFYPQSSS